MTYSNPPPVGEANRNSWVIWSSSLRPKLMLSAASGVASLSMFSRSFQFRQAVSDVRLCPPVQLSSADTPELVEWLNPPASRFTSRLAGPGLIPAEARLPASVLPATTLRTVDTQQAPS